MASGVCSGLKWDPIPAVTPGLAPGIGLAVLANPRTGPGPRSGLGTFRTVSADYK